jgi:hypothetical protein
MPGGHIFTGGKQSLLGAAALNGRDDLFDDAGVGELFKCQHSLVSKGLEARTYSCDISQRVLLAGQNLPQDPTHDLSTAGLGQVGNDDDRLGRREGTDALAHLQDQVLLQLVVDLVAILDGDEGVDGLAGKVVSNTNDGGFGDGGVLDERGLDLSGGQTVTGDVDDVVDTSADPVVAVVVTSGSVTCELEGS